MKYCKLHGWCLIMLWLWNRELSLSPGMLHATALTYWVSWNIACFIAFSALTLLLGGRKGIRSVRKEWWGAGMVICLERGVDLHMAQLMPLPLTVSSFSKIQICFTFPVPTHPGSCRIRAIKWVCVCLFHWNPGRYRSILWDSDGRWCRIWICRSWGCNSQWRCYRYSGRISLTRLLCFHC